MRTTFGFRKLTFLESGRVLELARQEPLRAGNLRVIYNYPGDASRLVKVYRQDIRQRGLTHYLKSLQHIRLLYKHTIPVLREIAEWARADALSGHNPHLQAVYGLVRTDLGLGMVVEALRQTDGELAPTLSEIILAGSFDAAMEARLEEFIDWFLASDVVAADIHCKNLVFDAQRNLFVLVDGSGDKTFIPLRSWFSRLNSRSKHGYVEELRAEVAARIARIPKNHQKS